MIEPLRFVVVFEFVIVLLLVMPAGPSLAPIVAVPTIGADAVVDGVMNTASLDRVLVLLTAVSWLLAHEGHLPLPTRGAAVDPVKGQINLSPDARARRDPHPA